MLLAKLYYRHGAMGSSKSMNLIATAYNYEDQGKSVLVLTSSRDKRSKQDSVESRAGMHWPALPMTGEEDLLDLIVLIESKAEETDKEVSCILVDECQLLPSQFIDVLSDVVDLLEIPVICYGLRTDYMGKLFPSSQRLFEIADKIEEVKTTCQVCNRKAIMNLRVDSEGNPITEGEQIVIGDEGYYPVCRNHYHLGLS